MRFVILLFTFFIGISMDCQTCLKTDTSVTISADTTIIVRELFDMTNCYLWGDSVDGNYDNGDFDSSVFGEVNGIKVDRDSLGIKMIIEFDKIKNESSCLSFPLAKNKAQKGKSEEWSIDTLNVKVLILREKYASDGGKMEGNKELTFHTLIKRIELFINESDLDVDSLIIIFCSIIGFFVLVPVLLLLLYIKVLRLSFCFEKNFDGINDIKSKIQSDTEENKQMNPSIALTGIKTGLTQDEVLDLIRLEKKDILQEVMQLQIKNISNKPVEDIDNVKSNVINNSISVSEFDSDDIKYNEDDNSFSIEKTSIKIFRIYSERGKFFYTIVDDQSIREELLPMLSTFSGCLTYIQKTVQPKSLRLVEVGQLVKEGDKFIIDKNHLLKLELI